MSTLPLNWRLAMRLGKWWLWLVMLTVWAVRAQPIDPLLESSTLLKQGHYKSALVVLNRAWKDQQKFTEEQLLEIQTRLGEVYLVMADYGKALEHLKASLRQRLRIFGPQKMETARAYDALGLSFLKLADSSHAFEFLTKHLRVALAQRGLQSNETALAYDHLGRAYAFIGEKEKAFELLSKAQRVWLQLFGAKSVYAAVAYNDLGLLEIQNGKTDLAIHFLEKAKRVREQFLGLNNIETAATLNSLGLAYSSTGKFNEAATVLEQAKNIREAELGFEHPDTGGSYNNLGVLALKQKQLTPALSWFGKAFEIFQTNTARNYAILDTEGKLRYNAANRFRLRTMLRASTDSVIRASTDSVIRASTDSVIRASTDSVIRASPDKLIRPADNLLQPSINNPQENINSENEIDLATALKLAGYWFSFKGSALAMEVGISPLYGQASGLKKGIDEYQTLRQEMAGLYTRTPATLEESKQISKRMQEVQKRLVELEREMSGRLNGVGDWLALRKINPIELANALNDDELYVDYAWFEQDVFALVVQPNGDTKIYWVAKTKDLERNVLALRQSAQRGENIEDSQMITEELYKKLIAPFENDLAGVNKIALSADGPLQFLPFELLRNPTNKQLLVEHFSFLSIPTARELLRLRQQGQSEYDAINLGPAAVFGNPSFLSEAKATENISSTTTNDLRGSGTVYLTQLLRRMNFNPLPFSETEARAVAGVLGGQTQLFLGEEANETNLFKLRSPKVLHLATHGFFLNESKIPNALLRVGLALSGARASAVNGDGYGLLTGLRLGGLNLEGTELVTLSACETALGENLTGEGVTGLNQAFLMAGAKRVMLSLWKVPDRETSQLMTAFYFDWQNGDEPSVALRKAKLKMMSQGLPPRDWAAFVLSGQ